MGRGNNAPTNSGASGAVGVEDDLSAQRNQRREEHMNEMRDTFSSFLNLPGIGALGLGGKPSSFPKETLVGDMAGQGAVKGMPTSNDDGDISLVYRQVRKKKNSSHSIYPALTLICHLDQPGWCRSPDGCY